jgi:DNA modification methylase
MFVAIAQYAKSSAECYVCCDWRSYPVVATQTSPKALIVWVKENFGLGMGYRPQHEFIAYWGNLNSTTESNVWNINRGSTAEYEHPTQKPVAIPERAILNSSKPGELILDLFGGSGSTLMACEQSDRVCHIAEIDPVWATVIIQRFGKQD